MKTTDELLLDALRRVRDEVNAGRAAHGICGRVWRGLGDQSVWPAVEARMRELFRAWPKFSGDVYYPIGGMHDFDQARHEGSLWDASRFHGRRRHELLDWMIDKLTIAPVEQAAKYGPALAAPTIVVKIGDQLIPATEVRRNMQTGALVATIPAPEGSSDEQ